MGKKIIISKPFTEQEKHLLQQEVATTLLERDLETSSICNNCL